MVFQGWTIPFRTVKVYTRMPLSLSLKVCNNQWFSVFARCHGNGGNLTGHNWISITHSNIGITLEYRVSIVEQFDSCKPRIKNYAVNYPECVICFRKPTDSVLSKDIISEESAVSISIFSLEYRGTESPKNLYQSTRCHIPENRVFYIHRPWNLKFRM
jgi:hypothetical protein